MVDEIAVYPFKVHFICIAVALLEQTTKPCHEQFGFGDAALFKLKPEAFVYLLERLIEFLGKLQALLLHYEFHAKAFRCVKIEQCLIQIKQQVMMHLRCPPFAVF
jgi:hypothetical protein